MPQRKEEGTAKELLAEIRAEKARLIKEKKIKKSKPLPEITDDEKPFDIPESWEWVRLNDIADYKKGPFGSALTKKIFVPKSNDTIKVYEQKNAIKKDDKLGRYYITSKYYTDKMEGFTVLPGDIIISCAGTIGETYILPNHAELGIINQALMRVRCFSIDKKYFIAFFKYITVKNSIKGKGTAIKNILPFAILKKIPIPLPPLAEQHRIVAKIEELQPDIDAYDKAQTKLQAIEQRFPDAMKKSLLQYAIEGKLVPQRKEEGTAKDLLAKIRAEKARLVKEKKIKKTKPLPNITDDEKPFAIPDSWEWVRMGDLLNIIGGTSYKNNQITTHGLRILRGGNINTPNISLYNDDVFLPLTFIDKEKLIRQNDILIVASTGSKKAIGRPGFVYGTHDNISIGAFLRICRLFYTKIFPYMTLIFSSEYYRNHIRESVQGTNINNVKKEYILNFLAPIPPLAEQRRIVAKLEELLPLCDQLAHQS